MANETDVTTATFDAFEAIRFALEDVDIYRQLDDNRKIYIILDIHGIWHFMSQEDRKVIFHNEPVNLVKRYIAAISLVSGNDDENRRMMLHVANNLKRNQDTFGALRANTAHIVSGWRIAADGVYYA